MPSGRIHLTIEWIGLGVSLGVLVGLNHFFEWVKWKDAYPIGYMFVGAYVFSLLFLSPDLDLARSSPQNRWGALRVLWIPYARLFKHRGWSHHPLIGTLTRIFYLGLWFTLFLAILHYGLEYKLKFLKEWWEDLEGVPLWALIAGLWLPNLLHIMADRFLKN